jgi:hypothetical protein
MNGLKIRRGRLERDQRFVVYARWIQYSQTMILVVAASVPSNVILGVVAGGVIGFISSIGTAALADHRKINEERRRFAALAAGSLSAVMHHLNRHNVVEHLRDAVQAARAGRPPDIILIVPIRGSFLESVGKLESSIALLPSQLIDRTSRAIILIRGLIEDFTTLIKTPASPPALAQFCGILISEIEEIQTTVPALIEELRSESRKDRDILTGYSD